MSSFTRQTIQVLTVLVCMPVAMHAQERVDVLDTLYVQAASRVPHLGQSAFRSVDVINRREIERLPAQTVADVLARILGVDVVPRSPAQADISIRGSTFEQVMVLVDGVKVSDEQTGHFDLDVAVPLEMIERIEVLRGTGSAMYGSDAVGGVINIVTRRSTNASVTLQGGSFGTGAAGFKKRFGSTLDVGGDYARSDGHRAGTDYEIAQGRVSAVHPFTAGSIGFDVGVGLRDFGAADFYAPFNSHERTTTLTSALRYESTPDARWQFAPQLHVRRHTDRFTLRREDPAFYLNEHESWQTGVEMVVRYVHTDRFGIAFGGEAFGAELQSARLGNRSERRAAIFSEATIGNPLIAAVNAGLRGDWGNNFDAFASPSLAASLRVLDDLHLRASASRGFRAATWTERYYTDPANEANPDLRTERFWTAEIGARWNAAANVAGDVAIFYRNSKDLIDWAKPADQPTLPWRAMNVEDASFTGVEARVLVPYVTLSGMLLSINASDAAGFVSKYALRQITEQVAVTLDLPLLPNVNTSAMLAHARRRLEGSFFRADVRTTWAVKQLRVNLDLLNLTDAEYLDASAKPVAGRGFAVGLAWSRQ
jgi:vitamin B12 transporter